MVIKRSAAQEIQALVADLGAASEVRRESAVARLAVIGTRAVDRLVAVALEATSAPSRVGALHALEAIGDQRALDPAFRCLEDADRAVVTASVDLLRRFLRSEHGATAFDRLIAVALDVAVREPVRLAALDALDEMPGRTLDPVWERLGDDPNEKVRLRATGQAEPPDARVDLEAIAETGLPEDPALVRELVSETTASAPLTTLHRLVTLIREREAIEPRQQKRTAWMVTRGAVHRVLAERDSRVALYDLRETMESAASALPVDFVAALARIGDATCLEPIATAFAAAAPEDDWWRRHLADAFRDIVAREGLTKRHQTVKRILARWPGTAALLKHP